MRATAASLLGATALVVAGCGQRDGGRPNVVLISVDTLRADHLGAYGHPRDTSPTMDALAARGTLFEDVTAASPWTLPSHASILTGMYPSTHGSIDHEYRLESETLATWFARAGFQTMAVVNSHNIGFEGYGLMRGFDEDTREWVFEIDDEAEEPKPIVNRAEEILDVAERFVAGRDPARPFFLFLHFYDVHTDFTPEPEWRERFVRPYDGRPEIARTAYLTQVRERGVPLRKRDVRHLLELYEAEIRTFDERLARLFEFLDDQDLSDRTVVALTSDHGEEFWEHGSVLHGRTYYQELVRIPLLLAGPGVPAGLRVATPVHQVDVAPTLYRLAGVAPPDGMDGVDLTLAWRDPDALPASRFLFGEADHNNLVDGVDTSDVKRMVRLEDTVLHYDTITGKTELYDLASDPGEQQDLAADDPERVQLLLGELERFLEREGAASAIGPVSDETQRLLDQLGYGGPGDGPRPQPTEDG